MRCGIARFQQADGITIHRRTNGRPPPPPDVAPRYLCASAAISQGDTSDAPFSSGRPRASRPFARSDRVIRSEAVSYSISALAEGPSPANNLHGFARVIFFTFFGSDARPRGPALDAYAQYLQRTAAQRTHHSLARTLCGAIADEVRKRLSAANAADKDGSQ